MIELINQYWYIFLIGLLSLIIFIMIIISNLDRLLKNKQLPKILKIFFYKDIKLNNIENLLKEDKRKEVNDLKIDLLNIQKDLVLWIMSNYHQKIKGFIYGKLDKSYNEIREDIEIKIDYFLGRIIPEIINTKKVCQEILKYFQSEVVLRFQGLKIDIFNEIIKNGSIQNMQDGIKNKLLWELNAIKEDIEERFLKK